MSDSCNTEAFVSLATNDSYATGALVLGKSLRDVGTSRKLALLISAGVSMEMRESLLKIWDELVMVEEMDSRDAESLAVLNRPELGVTFTKLAVWTLTQYSKCVYLDADTLVLQSVDELFSREELSAAPDIGWPDCFNSGVFVFRPSQDTFRKLVNFANQMGSFDGGDQGLLNMFWENWSAQDIKYHLPFTYNMTANSSYGYAPAFLKFRDNIKIIHFIGPVKPWQHRYLSNLDTVILLPGTYGSQHSNQDFIKRWWQVYASLSSLDIEPSILSGQVGADSAYPGSGTFSHRREFEAGFVDYHGRDSFDNIFAHMKLSMGNEGQGAGDSLRSTSASSVRSKLSSSWSKESYSDQEEGQAKDHVREEPTSSAGSSAGKPDDHSSSHSAASASGSQSKVQPEVSSGKTADMKQQHTSAVPATESPESA